MIFPLANGEKEMKNNVPQIPPPLPLENPFDRAEGLRMLLFFSTFQGENPAARRCCLSGVTITNTPPLPLYI